MSPKTEISASVCPFIPDAKDYKMKPDTELGALVHPYSPEKTHTKTSDPELGAVLRENNAQKSCLHCVLDKVAYYILMCSLFSLFITTLIISFFGIVTWTHPHTAQRWLENGPWGAIIWVLIGVNVGMVMMMEFLDKMLGE